MANFVKGWGMTKTHALPEQVLSNILVDASGCLLWQGSLAAKGYAQTMINRKNIRVHRLVYENINGPIPKGLTIDHLCRVRHCVNSRHMEAVTSKINILRGVGPTAQNARKTHCCRGHEFTDENTHISPQPARVCLTCAKRYRRESRERKAALASKEQG